MEWRNRVFESPARWLIAKHVSANKISFFRLFLTLPVFITVGKMPLLALVFLLLNFLLDGLDGVVARLSHSASIRGRALDVSIDNFFVIPIMLGLVMANLVSGFWASLYMVMILINYFSKYLKFGIEVGKYPFSLSKYFIYAALVIFALFRINIYDPIVLFWAVFLLIENVYLIFNIYYGRGNSV
jgi:phosphatidylglycerophosphate synthase